MHKLLAEQSTGTLKKTLKMLCWNAQLAKPSSGTFLYIVQNNAVLQ
jgi:hypothetical protein